MPGKLSWAIEFEGMPTALAGLKSMDAVVVAMTGHVNQLSQAFQRLKVPAMPRLGGGGGTSTATGISGVGGSSVAASLGLLAVAGGLSVSRGRNVVIDHRPTPIPPRPWVPDIHGGISATAPEVARGLTGRVPGSASSLGLAGREAQWPRSISGRLINIGGLSQAKRDAIAQVAARYAVPSAASLATEGLGLLNAGDRIKGQHASGFPLAMEPWLKPGTKGWPFSVSSPSGAVSQSTVNRGMIGGGQFTPTMLDVLGLHNKKYPTLAGRTVEFRGGVGGDAPPIIGGRRMSNRGTPAWRSWLHDAFQTGREDVGGVVGGGISKLPGLAGSGISSIFSKFGAALGVLRTAFAGITAVATATIAGLEILRVGFGAVGAVVHKVVETFNHLVDIGVKGAELGQASARLAMDPKQLYTARRGLGAAGIDSSAIDRLLLSGQFGRGQKIDFEGMTLGARRLGDRGTLQQMMNMKPIIQSTMNDPQTKADADKVAKLLPLFNTIYRLSKEIGDVWTVIEEKTAGAFGNAIKGVLVAVKNTLESISSALDHTDTLMENLTAKVEQLVHRLAEAAVSAGQSAGKKLVSLGGSAIMEGGKWGLSAAAGAVGLGGLVPNYGAGKLLNGGIGAVKGAFNAGRAADNFMSDNKGTTADNITKSVMGGLSSTGDWIKKSFSWATDLFKHFSDIGKKTPNQPNATTSHDELKPFTKGPASALEKMGLIIGSAGYGGNQAIDVLKSIRDNTARMVGKVVGPTDSKDKGFTQYNAMHSQA